MEIKPVNIVEFGNIVDMMTLEPHSEKRGFKDGRKYIRIISGIKRNNVGGNRGQEDSKARMNRHDEAGVSK